MDILIAVVNQKLKVTTNLKTLIAGTQEFIRLVFNLPSEWDNLTTFAQFGQDGVFYNAYLDEDNGVYLPSEIQPGTCTVMLYGSDEDVIATTNYLTLNIDPNILVSDAQSTDISQSLYTQLVTRVNNLTTWNEQNSAELVAADRELQRQINAKADQSDIDDIEADINNINSALSLKASQSQVDRMAQQLDALENSDVIANAIEDAVQAELAELISSGAMAALSIGDGSITRAKVDSDFEDTLDKADTAMQPSVYDPQNRQVDIFDYAKAKADAVQLDVDSLASIVRAAYQVSDTLTYNNLHDALQGILMLARNYTQAALADYDAFSITIVNELPAVGENRTFYLIPNSSGSFDKYWWITDENNISRWDTFGSATTLVVTELPEVGDEDTDYILANNGTYIYYKYISGYWEIVGGSVAEVLSSLPDSGNEYTDYYVLNSAGLYQHYRWINNAFRPIGSDAYTKSEIDVMTSALNDQVSVNTQNITGLSRTLERLAQQINSIDVEGLSYYATLTTENNQTYVYTLYEVDGSTETVKSQFTLPSGGGGGGSSSTTNLVVDKITPSPIICTTTDPVLLVIDYSSTDSDNEYVDGTYTIKRGSTTVMSGNLVQGRNTFDITDYCSVGSQKFTLTVTDEGGSINVKSWTVQVTDVRLESNFSDRNTYPVGSAVNFTYTPYGAIQKTVHFKLDGVELTSVVTSASGVLQSYSLPSQTHGAHLLECWMTAEINNVEIETEHIFKDIMWYDSESTVPIIGCIYRYDHYGEVEAKQYNTVSIPYVVFDPRTTTPSVTLEVDGEVVNTLRLSSYANTWAFKSEEIALHELTITCGATSVTIKVDVEELGYDISPVTANLEFDFNPVGMSNSSANRLWQDANNSNVKMSVSENFDWSNGGYHLDSDGNQYFCVKAGTRAYISYNMFANDPKQSGAEFKVRFKTMNVRDNQTTFLSCYPTEDNVKVGLKMNAHEAYLYSSTDSLYTPYSEEDIIEYEFNINPLDTENEDATSYIMSYEDGVAARPMLYSDAHRLYQYQPVPITIGSDDCDVYIYRMKAYSSSLTDSNILKNFIADAPDAETMIARYERNQIYDENNTLTPESVANACPDLKVIKIECPHFTNDKKDYVKYTNVECIHKNGDPILDNWRFVNGYHAGRKLTHYL